MRALRRIGAIGGFVVAMLAGPAAADAAITSVFGGDVSCTVQDDGVRFCGSSSPRSTTKTFDGVPLDVNVAFPPAPAASTDGGYPLVMLFHGYGGGKIGLSSMQRWLDRGYATFSMTDRGFRESCGSSASRSADPAGCANGYVRLIDTRYEVRDAQFLAGRLVDEGLVDPQKLGATGGSYGGGLSLALAALKNRVMMPDGSLVPWTSPNGTPMRLAAAAPFITWSDLAYALVPNGSTLDYVKNAPYEGRFGVMKESLINGLYRSGQAAPGFYAPEGSDPSADLTGWRNRLLAGEPYDGDPAAQAILDEITSHHSAYYIDNSVMPAPTLYSNGFTDDLFPVDEAIRFYNHTRAKYPKADLSLITGEIAGHPRSTNKQNVTDFLRVAEVDWFDHFVKGTRGAPFEGVTAFTQTCPTTEPGGGPYTAKNWAKIAKGEVRLQSKPKQTIVSNSGVQPVAAAFDPVTGGGSCAEASSAGEPDTANYDLQPAPSGGYTLLGSPTVIAKFKLPGNTSQVAARLLDVDPVASTEQLVARGLWRPRTGTHTQVFQLHPNAWHVDAGHIVRLQLLAKDDANGLVGGYGRPSNDQQDVFVSKLDLRLPVREKPGSSKAVDAHASYFLPKGMKLADDFDHFKLPKLTDRKLKASGSTVSAEVQCPSQFAKCSKGEILIKARGVNGKKGGSFKVASGTFKLSGGKRDKLKLKLTGRAKRYLGDHAKLPVKAKVATAQTPEPVKQKRKILAG